MKRTCFIALMLSLAPNPLVAAVSPLTEIEPPPPADTRCSLSLGSEVVDYGSQTRGQLQDASSGGNALTLGKRTLTLSVMCPYTQPLRLALRGDRATNGKLRYGERGSMIVRLFDMQRDGETVQITPVTPSGEMTGSAADSQQLQPDHIVAATLGGQPVKGKVFSARLEIEPVIPNDEAKVSASTTKEALLMLELVD